MYVTGQNSTKNSQKKRSEIPLISDCVQYGMNCVKWDINLAFITCPEIFMKQKWYVLPLLTYINASHHEK